MPIQILPGGPAITCISCGRPFDPGEMVRACRQLDLDQKLPCDKFTCNEFECWRIHMEGEHPSYRLVQV
jgi:hypothetical protein